MIAIESTPDSGVAMRKAVVAPLLAPCFCSDTAAGKTPQDHNGIGIPKRAALKTDAKRPAPKCWATEFGLRKTRNKPLTKRPKRTYTDDSSRSCQASANAAKTMFIDSMPPGEGSLLSYMFQADLQQIRHVFIIQRVIEDRTLPAVSNEGQILEPAKLM